MGIPNRAAPIDIEPLKDGSEAQHAGGQQQLVEAMASGLRSALTEILSSREAFEKEVEVNEVDNLGEVTVWIPGSTNHGLVASLTFALQVHKSVSAHRQTPYTVQHDLTPQIRSCFHEEPGDLLLAPGSKIHVPGSKNISTGSKVLVPGSTDSRVRIKPLDLQLTPTLDRTHGGIMTKLSSVQHVFDRVATDPTTMIYNIGHNLVLNFFLMIMSFIKG